MNTPSGDTAPKEYTKQKDVHTSEKVKARREKEKKRLVAMKYRKRLERDEAKRVPVILPGQLEKTSPGDVSDNSSSFSPSSNNISDAEEGQNVFTHADGKSLSSRQPRKNA